MLFCQNCDDMASQAPQMLQHLNEQGTPIMMGSLAVLSQGFGLFVSLFFVYVFFFDLQEIGERRTI